MIFWSRSVLRQSRAGKLSLPYHKRRFHVGVGLLEDLENRGFTENVTRPTDLKQHLVTRQVIYAGIDPTNRALHVGHLIPLMCLFHFYIRGHHIVPLIGGATACIGDPSGRSTDRPQLDPSFVEQNAKNLSSAVSSFFQGASTYAEKKLGPSKHLLPPEVLNNLEWHQNLNLLEFLRTAGYHSRVNTMMGRESVKARLESEEGISFTEFTYQLLQAYDFYELNRKLNCSIQIGGSDQWGNILAGVDLVNRMADAGQGPRDKAFGITTPLLTTSTGLKFSKSTGNAVWLDKSMTSYLEFYQFFLRATDDKVESWLKLFTLTPVEEIMKIMTCHRVSPHLRLAQRKLAEEVTQLVHGSSAVKQAKAASKVLFESDYSSINVSELLSAMEANPKLVFLDETEMLKTPLIKLGLAFEFFTSVSHAKNLMNGKGLKVNNTIIDNPAYTITRKDLLRDRIAIVKAGPHRHLILVLKSDK